jgi:hypothetical protein
MSSNCTNYVDSHMIITYYALCSGCNLYFSLQMNLNFLYTTLAVDIFIILFALFIRLLKSNSSAYIRGLIFLAC